MKIKFVTLSLFCAIGCLLIYSCSKQQLQPNELQKIDATLKSGIVAPLSANSAIGVSDSILLSQVRTVASWHNPGLALVLSSLKSQMPVLNVTTQTQAQGVVNLINSTMSNYTTTKFGYTNRQYYPYGNMEFPFTLYKCNVTSPSLGDVVELKSGVTMNLSLKTALNEVQSILSGYNDTGSVRTMSNYLLAARLPGLVTQSDKITLMAAVEIGFQSMIYWNQNFSTWQTYVGGNQSLVTMNSFSVSSEDPGGYSAVAKDMVYADVIGGAVGVVRGGIAGVTVGTMVVPGVGTVVGGAGCAFVGMAVGAVTGSASAGIEGCLRKWFNMN
ncbi:hypothetical protein [Chitinophaga sp. RAB17]|uniref:hypothetical protein n=1 Tax=Chitinophaga sp. RAB17 TaxID=3233049 RepID=UPI003F93AE53